MPQSIQMDEVDDLKKEWGDKPCDHQVPLMKEYYLGSSTGDYVCQCGRRGWGSDWNKKKK